MTTQIIWTALPNGFDASYFYFSVFVSHRLSSGSTLAAFPLGPSSPDPTISTNWASSVASGFEMQVSFGGGFVPAERLLSGYPGFWADLDPSVWTAIFPSTTPVDDYAAMIAPTKPSSRAVRTYSAAAIVRQHEALYANAIANSGADYPSVSALPASDFVTALGGFPGLLAALSGPNAFGGVQPAWGAVNHPQHAQFVGAIVNHYAAMGATAQAQDIALQHYFAYRFYRRSTASQYGVRNAAAVTTVPAPTATFHKLVGMLGDHPTLLRKLGLVLDYRVSRGNIPGGPIGPGSSGALRVQALWGGSGSTDNQFPLTYYGVTSDGFFAQESPAAGDILNGFLVLSTSNAYSVAQMDPDGASQKMIAYGISASGSTFLETGPPIQRPTAERNATESLPARRTGGLTVLKEGRAKALTSSVANGDPTDGPFARIDTQNTNLGVTPVYLNSADVCRGYRIDVWDASGPVGPGGTRSWRSLCQRTGSDLVVNGPTLALPPSDAEGLVKAASASRGDPGSDPTEQNTLYIHEAVFGWDGWSLCARRPGRAIAYQEGDANQHVVDSMGHPLIGFLPNHAPAGYPLVSNYAVTPQSLPRLRFGRTYYFRARTVDLAGNGLPLSYLGGVDPSTLATSPASPPATFLRYEPVAAPALVLLRALGLGESLESLVIRSNPAPVDDLSKVPLGGNATAYATANGLLDHCDRHVAPPKTSQIMAETHGMLDQLAALAAYRVCAKESGTFFDSQVFNVITGLLENLPAGELAFVPPPGPTTPGDPPASGQYVLHTLDTLTMPYLPDPLADGLALKFAGTPIPPLDPTLSAQTVLSYVVDSPGWPRVHAARLVVQESGTASITYVTTPSPATLTVGLPPATIVVVRSSTSPSPALVSATAVASTLAGDPAGTAVALRGGNWLLSPYRELTLVHAVQRPLLIPTFVNLSATRDTEGQTFVILEGKIQNDPRSTGHLDIYAAWTDPIDDPANPDGPQMSAHTGHAFQLTVAYTDVAPTSIQPDLSACANTPGCAVPPTKRHEFGDTKHRWVTYSADATTRYREHFPLKVTSDLSQITTKGVTQILNILSSRRPDPMNVLYAVPTFKWSTSSDQSTVTRTGRGIRVYFDRPWYSSGDDELVGVLLAPGGSDPTLTKYTSEWGRDPVWSSSSPPTPLAPEHFTNRIVDTPQPSGYTPNPPPPLSVGPYPLAEDPSLPPANVVAFKPEFNRDRRLWFIDIEMDPGDSYFPFVRLALCRYQPHAIGSGALSLSRVVRTEFLQLVPDRTAAISYGSGMLNVTVTGVGAYNQLAEQAHLLSFASPRSGALMSSALGGGNQPPSQLPDSSGGGHRLTAQVQERPSMSNNDLLWDAGGNDEVELFAYAETGGVMWAANVSLPKATAGLEYRLLVRERERHAADSDTAAGDVSGIHFGERLVYAAAFPLTLM
jgi:hypothetical protein